MCTGRWDGLGLFSGPMMVTLGCVIAVVMGRFDAVQLHQPDPAFLSIPFFDMLAFGTLLGLAIVWRGKPELHRRFLVLATCGLLDAAFGRFDYLFNHSLFYVCVDAVMLLGVARDLLVDQACAQGLFVWDSGVGDWAEPGDLSVARRAWVVGFELQRDSWHLTVRALRECPLMRETA